MNNIFDIGVIGLGVAGVFATYKLAKEHKNVKVIAFDMGKKYGKRRRQIDGWLGCLPNGDGKLYMNDVSKVSELIGLRKAKSSFSYFNNILANINDFKVIKDKSPSISASKRLKKNGFDVILNDYTQIYPKDIHALSKYMAESIEKTENITFSFDNEIKKICKQKGVFVITSEDQEYRCKKIILAVGRSGWHFAKEVFSDFGIVDNNDVANFGIRVEINSSIMKDFNKSNCTILKNDLEIGPLSWFGSVIPEDHVDLAISAFRSNENRWKTDKVSFSLIGHKIFPNNGSEQTDRIGKLTFVLANDRIIKERVSCILTDKSKISIIPEYNWLKEAIIDLATVIPEITTKAYFHVPTIVPLAPKINIGNNLESELEGLFIVGESAGCRGILSAGMMGCTVANEVCK